MKISLGCMMAITAMLLLGGSGCATRTPPTAKAMQAGAVMERAWVRTELYFSIGDWTETALSTEAELKWAKFLDAEVTPRFPDGLNVIDVYGQWRSAKPGAVIERERSRLLVILHADSAEESARIEDIRTAWKQQAGEESVMRVSQPAKVSF
jgi:Protein of unknown function (DUF3574)